MARYICLFYLLVVSGVLQAQSWEFGGFLAAAGYMGDLNPNNPLKVSGPAAGPFVSRDFNGYLSLKLAYTYGQIAGADSTSSLAQFRERNLSFRTQLSELSIAGELNFLKYVPGSEKNRFTPFAYLGIAVLAYNPQASYKGLVYDLRPLRTEGQKKPYPTAAVSLPYGVGVKYNFSGKWNLIADIGYRQPGTDYLDDVSGLYADKSKFSDPVARSLSDRSGENTGVYTGSAGSQRGDLRPHDTYFFIRLGVAFALVSGKCYF